MFRNRMPRYEVLSEQAMATLDGGWRRLMTEIGVEFMDPRALQLFRDAGQKVEDNTVFLDPDFVLEQVAKAPSEFEVQARQEFKATVSLNKRPKNPNVVVQANELKLRKQVHFAHDSAQIEPDSQALDPGDGYVDLIRKERPVIRLEAFQKDA